MGEVVLEPGSGALVGIVGGGQLGRMVAMEARRLGLRTCVLDPDPASPAAQVADEHVRGELTDPAAARALGRRCRVVTYEFENVSVEAVRAAEEVCPVRPASTVLEVAQHRVREKEAVARLGVPVPRFRAVRDEADLEAALREPGLPLVLKTATSGYDGKGQAVVHREDEARAAFAHLRAGCACLIAEELVDFALEVSVICARSPDGRLVAYAPGENRHRRGILDLTVAPARVPAAVAARAREIAAAVAEGLGVVGLLAVEMFVTRDGRVLVNELAPRPHNSGHHTLDACPTSQFEQLLRAICGLPLGEVELYRPAAMANLLGDLWPPGGRPPFARALEVPGVKLHLYGKTVARPGRKMGHLTALGDTVEEAAERVLEARRRLGAAEGG
jgi:5-(carboxyamino)imidazole ribonucleotide synthase